MFSSLHRPATVILMEELERAGITGYVGKVNMDRNAAPGVLEETTEESMRETLRWLEACGDFRLVKPMLTPRFIPSCSDEVLTFLGKLAAERKRRTSISHLSENQAEMEWVRQLHPDCKQYWRPNAKFGLWNSRTVMAHCVWSDARERRPAGGRRHRRVHCADSNLNICSGTAPGAVMLQEGSGWPWAVTLPAATPEYVRRGGFLHSRLPRPGDAGQLADGLSHRSRRAGTWGTSAGAAFFGEAPGFAPGNPLHAMVVADDASLQPHPLTRRNGWSGASTCASRAPSGRYGARVKRLYR
jgi:guanine deaminase